MPTKSISYRVGEAAVRMISPLATRRCWLGVENLPRATGFVAVANHASHADPVVVAHYLTDNGVLPRFLAKDGVFRVPIFGRILTNSGQIPVYRESTDAAAAFGAAVRAVQAGECVVIYPEGTLTRDPKLWPMRGKSGAARIALQTGCPVIPVVHWGSHELLPRYRKVPRLHRRPKVTVKAFPAVDLSAYRLASGRHPDARTLVEATATIMAAVTAGVAELRGETPPATVWNPKEHGQATTGDPHRHRPERRRRRRR